MDSTDTADFLDSHPWTRFGIAREAHELLVAVFHTLARRFHFSADAFFVMPEMASQVLLLPLALTCSEDFRQTVEQLRDSRLSFSDVCNWYGKVAPASLSWRPVVSRLAAVHRFLVHDTDKQFGLSVSEQSMLICDSDEGIFRLPATVRALLTQGRELVTLREFLKAFGDCTPFSFPSLTAEDGDASPGRFSKGSSPQRVTFVAGDRDDKHTTSAGRSRSAAAANNNNNNNNSRSTSAAHDEVSAQRQVNALHAAHHHLMEHAVSVNTSPLQSNEPNSGAVTMSVVLGGKDRSAEEEEEEYLRQQREAGIDPDARSASSNMIVALAGTADEQPQVVEAARSGLTPARPSQYLLQPGSPSGSGNLGGSPVGSALSGSFASAGSGLRVSRRPPPKPFFRNLNERVIAVLAARAACAVYAEDKSACVTRFLIGLDSAESSVPFAEDIRAALGELSMDMFHFTPATDRHRNQILVIDMPACYIVAVAGFNKPNDLVDMCDFLPLIDPLRGPKEHPAAYHRGAYRRAAQLPSLQELCPTVTKPVMLCGHGFGGSILETYLRLFAAEAARALGSFLVTFGAMAVHRNYLVDMHKVWRFVAEGDFVPAVLSLCVPKAIAYTMPSSCFIRIKELTNAENCGPPAPATRQRPFELALREAMSGPHEAARYVANVENAAVWIEGKFPPTGLLSDS